MEVVLREGGVKACARRFSRVGGDGTEGGGNVVEGGPFKEAFVGTKGDFLEPAVCDPAQVGVDALGGQVSLLGLIDCSEGGFAVVDNIEFVLVQRGEAPL